MKVSLKDLEKIKKAAGGDGVVALRVGGVTKALTELSKARASRDYYAQIVETLKPWLEKSPIWASILLSARGHAGGKARHAQPPDADEMEKTAVRAVVRNPRLLRELPEEELRGLARRLHQLYGILNKSLPTLSLPRRTISSANRHRRSVSPPHRSWRRLVMGEKNWWTR